MKRIQEKPRLSSREKPTRKHNVIYITRLKGEESENFCIYSRKAVCYMTHWTDQGTVPCWEDHSLCQGGHKEGTLRENWLLHGWSITKSRETFIYLTPTALEKLLEQLPPGTDLRGKTIKVTRSRSGKGRLSVGVNEFQCRDPDSMPPARDAYESILNFLRVSEPPNSSARPSPGPLDLQVERNGHPVG